MNPPSEVTTVRKESGIAVALSWGHIPHLANAPFRFDFYDNKEWALN